MSVPHNPNRGGAKADTTRPHTVQHPLFSYTTRVPVHGKVADDFPSPFLAEPDFTPSPPLLYAHPRPVEACMAEHFTKYPHESVPEIIECPVVRDTTDPATGVRTRERKVICKNIAPWIFRRVLGGPDTVELTETTTFDPRTRQFELHSQNVNFARFVFAKEASRFVPHPDNPEWTSFVQYGGIRCTSYMGPLKRPLEQFICNRMIRGGLQASDHLDDVLAKSQSPFE